MIRVSHLKKSYGKLQVLKGVNLEIKQGEIIAIVGASGAGKSTLLQIIGTLDRSDSGSVLINNTDVFALKDDALAAFRNRHIGFIFQFHHLLPEFTSLENVCIPAFLAGKGKHEARELLNYLGLSDRLDHKPSALSGGEQQRVAVARALINKPDVVLADEPSGNLDSKTAEELHNLFFELRDRFNQTFVIVTHNKELAAMADRSLTIRDGVI